MKELHWKRLLDVICLPFHLVELLEKEGYTSQELYTHLSTALWNPRTGTPNRNSQLWVLIKENENIPRGFCWLTVPPLKKCIEIEAWVVGPEERKGKPAIAKLCELIEIVLKEENLPRAQWATKAKQAAKKHGFTRSKKEIMEYNRDNAGDLL